MFSLLGVGFILLLVGVSVSLYTVKSGTPCAHCSLPVAFSFVVQASYRHFARDRLAAKASAWMLVGDDSAQLNGHKLPTVVTLFLLMRLLVLSKPIQPSTKMAMLEQS